MWADLERCWGAAVGGGEYDIRAEGRGGYKRFVLCIFVLFCDGLAVSGVICCGGSGGHSEFWVALVVVMFIIFWGVRLWNRCLEGGFGSRISSLGRQTPFFSPGVGTVVNHS
ncbi:hypothetical protein HOY82DRAFT_357473 [Tuber indicum]|nr:hypothetical protein HOY82DRAFT_357473 [Tuber indicum]